VLIWMWIKRRRAGRAARSQSSPGADEAVTGRSRLHKGIGSDTDELVGELTETSLGPAAEQPSLRHVD